MRRIAPIPRVVVVLLPLLGAGCADIDPYLRPYAWKPEGAPEANFAAQLADPLDLVRGRGSDGTSDDGARAAAAIAKWNKEGPGGGKSLEGAAGSMSSGKGGS